MTGKNMSSRSKVAGLIEDYDLDEIGDVLERRWVRQKNRSSLRNLAEYFNQELLRAAITTDTGEPLDGEIENFYRLLTDDEVTSGVRQQVRNRLEGQGVDVSEIERDFVSYQAIRTYLKDYRGATPPSSTASLEDDFSRKRETVQRLKTRLAVVTERSLAQLRETDRFTLGEFNVVVTVRVHCTECDAHRSITDLFDDFGCDCQS